MPVKEKYKNKLLSIIFKHLPKSTLYLFGSRATGKERSGSDIDIAIDTGSKIPFKTILALQIEIDDTTIPLKVDIVDFHAAPKELKQEILTKGIQWTQ